MAACAEVAAHEDGHADVPAEAPARGVAVIVSEDTCIRELVDPPRTGLILPTDALDALTKAIAAADRGAMFAG